MNLVARPVRLIVLALSVLATFGMAGCGQSLQTKLFTVHPGPIGCTHKLVFTRNGSPNKRLVALSFDDGVSPETQHLFEILRQHHATATFFLIGHLVPGHRNLLRAMIGDGMEFGNHSYSHPSNLAELGPLATRQLGKTSNVIQRVSGFRPCLFRPPYGVVSPDLVQRAKELGMTTVKWKIDSGDYLHPGVEVITQRVLNQVRPGYIVVMHDNPNTHGQTVQALPTILKDLAARGYKVVTITQILGQKFIWPSGAAEATSKR
jgi:peptidoglycan/xylan/chitin deacetylase (PgdA/CDA1 family)